MWSWGGLVLPRGDRLALGGDATMARRNTWRITPTLEAAFA